MLAFAARPRVRAIGGNVETYWNNGQLRLNYRHDGLARVRVDGDGQALLLLVADTEATRRIWRHETAKGPVLMIGSHLLRTADWRGPPCG